MQSSKLRWSIPGTPFSENASAFDCVGSFCILGVASSLYVVEQPTMNVVDRLTGHPPQSSVTCATCCYSNLVGGGGGHGFGHSDSILVASGDTQGNVITWILHEGSLLNVLARPKTQRTPREIAKEDQGKGSEKAVRSICWSGSNAKLLVALYEKSEVVVWDHLKGQVAWQSCLNPKQDLTHMVQSSFDNTCLCVTNDQGLVYILYVTEAESEEDKVQQVEYMISASDSKFMRCRFGMKENLLHIVLEHTLIAFDIDYGIPVGSAALAKKHSAFQDILKVHYEGNHLLCSHQDGSISAWECNESKSIYTLMKLVPSVSMGGLCPQNSLVHAYAECKMHESKFGDALQLFVTTSNSDTGGYMHYFSARSFLDLQELKLESMLRFLPQQCTAFSSQPVTQKGDCYQVAFGTNIGTVEVVDLMTGLASRSFKVHTRPVLGVKWLQEDLILSFAVDSLGANAFNNELMIIHVTSGSKKVVRGSSGRDPSSLRGVRTSKSGSHFLLIFKNGITELWRVDKASLACVRIRVMNMPFTCVEFVQDIPFFFFTRQRGESEDNVVRSKRDSVTSSGGSLGSLTSNAEDGSRRRSNSQAETSSEQREILLFALPDRTMGAVEIFKHTKKLKDLKPNFPVIDISPGEVITALSCTEQTLVVGTSTGELKLWSHSREHFGTYRLASWEGSVRKIISDPCFISSDFLILSSKNMFHRINVDHMPLKIERTESNLPGTEILDTTWVKNEHGRQYVMCTRDGISVYSDQGVAFAKPLKSFLLDPKTPERLALYMQTRLSLSKLKESAADAADAAADAGGASTPSPLLPNLIDFDDGPMDTTTTTSPSSHLERYPKAFRALASDLEMTELESQQAFESYRKFVAELEGRRNGISTLVSRYKGLVSPSDEKNPPSTEESLDYLKLVASYFGKSPEEFEFWDKAQATLANVVEGNYGGSGCLWDSARQKRIAAKSICWHESFTGTLNASKSERRVLEYFVLGDRESAIAFLLATSPNDKDFYKHALRAISLSSFPSGSDSGDNALQEKTSKVLSAHCGSHDDVLSSIVMLGLIGKTLDAVHQLQDVGMWEHAATMTASYLQGDERQLALERWAGHVINTQKNLWKGLGILLSAGLVWDVLRILDEKHMSMSFVCLYRLLLGHAAYTSGEDKFQALFSKHTSLLKELVI